MDLLVDSTVFWDDPNLKSEAWKLIKEYLRRTDSRAFVPTVVRHEIEAKFVERLTKEQDHLASAAHEVARLTDAKFNPSEVDVSAQAEKYGLRLDSRLHALGVRILPYPQISHEALVQRQLRNSRPFQPRGTGYRDALIWFSLLEELKKESRDCVIVTNNTNDFSQHKDAWKSLHNDFQAALDASEVKAKIEVRRNLDEFIEDFVKPTLKRLDDFREELQKGQPIDLKEHLEDNFNRVFEGVQRVHLHLRLPGVPRLQEPIGVWSLNEEPSHLEIDDVLELNEQEAYIEFHAAYEAEIFGYLFKTDVFSLREDSDVYVTDIDWNEHYAEVGANVQLEVHFGAIYDRDENQLVSLEVKAAKSEKEY